MIVTVKPQNLDRLAEIATAVSTPGSAQYVKAVHRLKRIHVGEEEGEGGDETALSGTRFSRWYAVCFPLHLCADVVGMNITTH